MTGFPPKVRQIIREELWQDQDLVDVMGRRRVIPSTMERVKKRLVVTDAGCHEFRGYRNPKGYGQIGYRGIVVMVHRAVWVAYYGNIPTGMLVCHRCDNPPCCNPEHLFLGTHQDNSSDMVAKGRFKRLANELSGKVKLSRADVAEIRSAVAAGEMQKSVALRYNVSSEHVCKICSGKRRQSA